MDFSFSINNLFGFEVSKVDRNLAPFRSSPDKYKEYRKQLIDVIDQMGQASARAQGLKTIITTGSKLTYSDHTLYVMKDAEANNGLGAVVGFLKVGQKKLFIYDSHGNHHESDPLCALDFYVHESRQRMGCGRKLFEFMIKSENIKAQHIAIDRPSHKFLSFLQKHYNLKATIPQVNNFVVFDGYFRDRPNGPADRRRGKPPTHPYRKELSDRADPRPSSARAALARLEQEGAAADSDSKSAVPYRMDSPIAWDDLPQRASSAGQPSPSYSPHLHDKFSSLGIITLDGQDNSTDKKESLKDVPVPRPGSIESERSPASGGRPSSANTLAMGNDRAMGAQHSMYSRHTLNATTPPGPPTETHRPTQRDPPMLRRDGPSADYLHLLNGDLSYQDRRGHLKVVPLAASATASDPQPPSQVYPSNTISSTTTVQGRSENKPPLAHKTPFATLPVSNPYTTSSKRPQESSFNVLGVPTSSPANSGPPNNRRFQQTGLW